MWFCPLDGTLLQVRQLSAMQSVAGEDGVEGYFYCSTCPYSCPIKYGQPVSKTIKFTVKKVDDILGGADAWKNVDRTAAACPACNHQQAYYKQIQIRSADEPMSIFYKCCSCGHQWNDR